ncbi:MAG: hypothetical protein JNM27_00695 [Leptospirales bacterium]|nr:hypothetical protein [Leptospirales bacterium]
MRTTAVLVFVLLSVTFCEPRGEEQTKSTITPGIDPYQWRPRVRVNANGGIPGAKQAIENPHGCGQAAQQAIRAIEMDNPSALLDLFSDSDVLRVQDTYYAERIAGRFEVSKFKEQWAADIRSNNVRVPFGYEFELVRLLGVANLDWLIDHGDEGRLLFVYLQDSKGVVLLLRIRQTPAGCFVSQEERGDPQPILYRPNLDAIRKERASNLIQRSSSATSEKE